MKFNKQISTLLTAVITAAAFSGLTQTASASISGTSLVDYVNEGQAEYKDAELQTEEEINSGIYVGSKILTDKGLTFGDVTAAYDSETKGVTLSGTGTIASTQININGVNTQGAGIFTANEGTLTINLADGADITIEGRSHEIYSASYTIYAPNADIKITGKGRLTVKAPEILSSALSRKSNAIQTSGSVIISEAKVYAVGLEEADGYGSRGIEATTVSVENNGGLLAQGATRAIHIATDSILSYYEGALVTASNSYDGANPVEFVNEYSLHIKNYKYICVMPAESPSGVYVASKQITSMGILRDDISVSYDADTQTLGLSGTGTIASTQISVDGVNTQGAGIFTANEGTLTINLANDADITIEGRSHEIYSEAYTVYAPNADIKITGKGRLTVKAPESLSSEPTRKSNAIQTSGSVVISEAKVYAVGLEEAGGFGSRGIEAAAVSVENNGKLLAQGATRAIQMATDSILSYYEDAAITASNNYDGANPVEFVNEYSSNIKNYKYIRVMPAESPSGVYVASEQITSMGMVRGGVSAAYDADTQTLVLSGTGTIASTQININGVNTQGAGIFTENEGTLTINLADDADITVEGRSHEIYSEAYTVYAPNADIKITGKGRLTVRAPESLSSEQTRQSNAIQTSGSVVISEAEVYAVGLEEAGGYGSRGIDAAAVSVENTGALLAQGATRAIQMANDSILSYYEDAEITASNSYDGTNPVEFVNEYNSNIKNYKYISIMPPGPSYENSGEQIIFYKDTQLDLANEPHTEKLYKLFIGWRDANGNAVSNNITYQAGTVLNAEYTDFNADGENDFVVTGAQFRTEDGDVPEGLRFITNVSSRIRTELDPSEYGAVAIPLEIAGIGEPELGKVFTYNGKEYPTGSISAEKIFAQDDNSFKYTMCITNLEGKYTRQYIVRGYMKYNDINGISRILYTDQFGANAYAAVKTELADETVTDERRTALTAALEKMETERAAEKAAYMSQPSTDVVGTSADKNNWIYQLENGIMVREAEIDSGNGGDPVEIVQITDTHFNYCNDKDYAENNKQVINSANINGSNAHGATLPNVLACMKYASYSDKTIVTGDTFSYLSRGGIELMYKAIWQQNPETLIAMGNHEPRRAINGSDADTAAESENYMFLQSQWKHDIYYTSEVVKDKVMVVVMDNQKHKYWESQYDLLAADITSARAKGIPILIFEHTALLSRNPAEAALGVIRHGDTSRNVWNFYEGDSGLLKYGQGDAATDKVYDLIVNNGDVIKGIFCGDMHEDMYSEVMAKTPDGENTVIPQYILNGAFYDKGHVLKITVK